MNGGPNYLYCISMCPGMVLNCPHYVAVSNDAKVCKTYRLLDEIAPARKYELSAPILEKIIEKLERKE